VDNAGWPGITLAQTSNLHITYTKKMGILSGKDAHS
jgi:hypothetical protein